MRARSAATIAMACLLVGLATDPSHAVRAWMQSADILKELTGVKLAGIYPSNVAWTEVIAGDGTSDYEEQGQHRRGRWTVAGELYCFEYQLAIHGGCFRIVKHSANCYELYTASLGGHMPATPPPATSMAWNGRMWRDAERTTCNEAPIS